MKKPANHNKPWTPREAASLKKMAKGNTPTRVIALNLGRTEDAVRGQAKRTGQSLKPTNQSPYNKRKK